MRRMFSSTAVVLVVLVVVVVVMPVGRLVGEFLVINHTQSVTPLTTTGAISVVVVVVVVVVVAVAVAVRCHR